MQRLEAARHRARSERRPGPHRPVDALELPGPEVFELEQMAEKSARALRDHHRIGLGDSLQAGRKVGSLAGDATLLRIPRSEQVADHDEPGGNADARPQR